MPLKSFNEVPKNLVEWGRYFRSLVITPDPGSVGADQLKDGSVLLQKIQNLQPNTIVGRATTPEGVAQELTVSDGLEFSGLGIRRSELTGDITSPAGSNATTLRNAAGCSVIGRSANDIGPPNDIVAPTNGLYLQRNADVASFGPILDVDLPSTIARDSEVSSAIAAAIAALNLDSGTYTPTLSNTTNVAASTAYLCQYLRVGSTVTVSGRVDVDPTTTGQTVVGISLPIASAFTNGNDCGGAAFCPSVAGQGAAVYADPVNDRAIMEWIAVDTTSKPMSFSFAYRII